MEQQSKTTTTTKNDKDVCILSWMASCFIIQEIFTGFSPWQIMRRKSARALQSSTLHLIYLKWIFFLNGQKARDLRRVSVNSKQQHHQHLSIQFSIDLSLWLQSSPLFWVCVAICCYRFTLLLMCRGNCSLHSFGYYIRDVHLILIAIGVHLCAPLCL